MHKSGMIGLALCATMSLGACTTSDTQGERALKGAGIGAASGAALGAVVGGVDPVSGALLGAAAGGLIGAITHDKNRNWRKDTRGYCYYVDNDGRHVYDRSRSC